MHNKVAFPKSHCQPRVLLSQSYHNSYVFWKPAHITHIIVYKEELHYRQNDWEYSFKLAFPIDQISNRMTNSTYSTIYQNFLSFGEWRLYIDEEIRKHFGTIFTHSSPNYSLYLSSSSFLIEYWKTAILSICTRNMMVVLENDGHLENGIHIPRCTWSNYIIHREIKFFFINSHLSWNVVLIWDSPWRPFSKPFW